ncbi:hypothetical protein MYAM1_003205 [Malassezia yamatoensis]|uniref:Uncharacterized protein n=1 Tax=Malassezia yamatoensis TaxID=253288 RepID=A0AAJ5YUH7_9BASI|nr:hypothetical protein MYAM1_003205 [Malassezia yamatoensis]
MSTNWKIGRKSVNTGSAGEIAQDVENGQDFGFTNPSSHQQASSFSVFEGRNSRFHTFHPEGRTRPDGFQPSSYSANTEDIRDDTAELGDMALTSDDGSQGTSSAYDHRYSWGNARDSQKITVTEQSRDSQEVSSRNKLHASHNPTSPSANTHPTTESDSLLPQHSHDTSGSDYGAFRDGQRSSNKDSRRIVAGDAALEAVGAQWSSLREEMAAMTNAARSPRNFHAVIRKTRDLYGRDLGELAMEPIKQLPAVILGLLMNILDGVSYGMITFPTSNAIFASFGGDGVSMFFMTCLISQLVYTLGGSIFKAGNGTFMIEVVPFYHILVQVIVKTVGEDNPQVVIATTMVAFALSSIFIGLVFFMLGTLRLGVIISYFPRHILVGCIGGVGVFLIETGFAVAGHIEEEGGFKYNGRTLAALTDSTSIIAQWTIPLFLAILLCFINSRYHHPLILPTYFLLIPVGFYIVAMLGFGQSLKDLQKAGWVFDVGTTSQTPFYHYFSYFDLRHTSFKALWATIPSQIALVAFGILHVPLNVPALGISIGEDNVDTDRELIAHGISNIAAGMFGTVPNYLCYVNSVLFYRVGGGSRLSGLMLAAATAMVMLLGPGMISYLPVMVVGALIFVLGIDLVREAIYDTIGRVNRMEYLTIVVIVVVMTSSDFVVGSLVGLMLACLFFVMQTSQRSAVRSVFNGHSARSTVRRHAAQRRFLDDAGHQTVICKLQGALFFGTINSVEQLIRKMLDIATWKQNPIRFLVMDLTQVNAIDFSAAEAMTRIHRMLNNRGVLLVLCGVKTESDLASALQNVDLWTDLSMHLEVFASLNEALEWTENEYLRGMYSSGLSAGDALGRASLSDSTALRVPTRKPVLQMDGDPVNSPRYEHLHQAAKNASQAFSHRFSTGSNETRSRSRDSDKKTIRSRAHSLLLATLGPYTDDDVGFQATFQRAATELEEVTMEAGAVLWEAGASPDACMYLSRLPTVYFIESGILKARYVFEQDNYEINEAMLAGTIAGELSFLSQQNRNSTVTVEKDARIWRLNAEALQRIGEDSPEDYARLVQAFLRVTADEHDCLMSYLVSRLS